MCRYTIIAIVSLLPLQVVAAKHPTAFELLDKYAETQDQFQSFRAKVTTLRRGFSSGIMAGKPWKARYFTERDVRFDKNRASSRSLSWGRMNSRSTFTKDKPYYVIELWDGQTHYQYTEVRGEPVTLDIGKARDTNMREGIIKQSYSIFSGYYYPFDGRVDRLLRKAENLSVRRTTEKVGRSPCYVIDGVYEKDKYTIWIDPEHGYHIAKAVVERPRSNVQGLQGFRGEIKNVRFKKVDGRWIPVEANLVNRFDYNNGHYCTDSYHIKVTEMVFDPDHDALGSFLPDDIRDGAPVSLINGVRTKGYRWRNGGPVDEKGRKVDYKSKKTSRR